MAAAGAISSLTRAKQQDTAENIINTLTKFYTKVKPGEDPDKIRAAVESTLMIYFGLGAVTSLADVGSDFFDFSIGRSLSDIMSPLSDAVIIEPLKDAVKPIVRLNSPSERFLLALLEAGFVDARMINRALLDHRIRPEYLRPILEFAASKHNATATQINVDVAREIDNQRAALYERELAQFEGQVSKIESDLLTLSDQARELPLTQKIQVADRVANKLESLINSVLVSTGKAEARAVLLLEFTLSKAGRIR